jgi:hypothetical protein
MYRAECALRVFVMWGLQPTHNLPCGSVGSVAPPHRTISKLPSSLILLLLC